MIYICYGVTKTASTFLYQPTEATLRAAGRPVVRVGLPLRPAGSLENYFDFINLELLDRLRESVGGGDLVLKTHGPPLRPVAELIASGKIQASASIRDPREIALSMIDHGQLSRRRGKSEFFAEFVHPADTLPALDLQLSLFQAWAGIAGVEVFTYNDICHDSAAVVGRIARQLGVEVNPQRILRGFRHRTAIGQFNKGRALRYVEMPVAERGLFLERYAPIYQAFSFETDKARLAARKPATRSLRLPGALLRHLVGFRRRFRI